MAPEEEKPVVVQPLQASVGYGWRMGHGRKKIKDRDQSAHRAAVFEAIAAAENW